MCLLLTNKELDCVINQAKMYRPGFGYAFACGKVGDKYIESENLICDLVARNKAWQKKAAPEVALARFRGQLNAAGVNKALSDLLRWFNQYGQNYLDTLDKDPKSIEEIIIEFHRAKTTPFQRTWIQPDTGFVVNRAGDAAINIDF